MTIFVVSTEVETGKGGISTALVGIRDANAFKTDPLRFISSHSSTGGNGQALKACREVARQVKSKDMVWLHCGPWFSILRKSLIGLVASAKGARLVFHFHSPKMDDYLRSGWARFWLRFLLKWVDGVVVLTPWWKQRFEQVFPQFSDKILVSPNPLDGLLEKKASQPCITLPDKPTRILSMARLVSEKGVSRVIDMMRKLPEDTTLTVAGDGPAKESLEQQVAALSLADRVSFTGWVDYQQKHDLLASHHLFVLPSKYDSFGMGFVEAMAYGMPVVALNRQAIPDVVSHKKSGFLCQSDSAEELAEAVNYCLRERSELGAFAKRHVAEKFNKEQIAESLLNGFKQIGLYK